MRLAALELENFKGIGRRQRVELRPITLLFGPNSAGKSMIIQALHYLHGILRDGELDPQSFLGGQIDVGGFRQMLHRHELDRVMGLSVTATDMALEDAPWLNRERLEELGFTTGFQCADVHLWLKWSETRSTPYMVALGVWVDGEHLGGIATSPDGRRIEIVDLGFDHPMLTSEALSVRDVLSEHNALSAGEALPLQLDPGRGAGRLPRTDRELAVVLSADPEESAENNDLQAVLQLISFGIVVPLAALERELGFMLHVGPFRTIPARSLVPHESLQRSQENWYDGLAAYGFLAETARQLRGEDELVATINDWLKQGALNTGYRLDLRRIREVPTDHWLFDALAAGEVLDVADEVPDIVRSLPERSRIVVTDERTKTELSPADIGVGFSQVVPIIAAAILGRSIVAIEQPELHLHPAQQVALGDLFLYTAFDPKGGQWGLESKGRGLPDAWAMTFLIETHSEHLILRFLRRVRQTSAADPGFGGPILKPDEIAVHWIEPGVDGATVRRLRIDEDGDFIDPWPRGFFEEREDGLFG